MDLIIKNQTLPIIEVNFEEVRQELSAQLQQYKGLIVTEENLSMCKSNQKSLAGLKAKVDSYRKDVKKTMSAPIAIFEDKCKQLVALIESAEQPLKEGIKVFDDKKREEKRQIAQKIIAEVIEKHGINEKYAKQLTVLDKYTNLTATVGEVKEDIEQRAFILLGEQNRERELLELIQDSIDTENKRINKKLSIADFQMLINRGIPTKDIIQSVHSQAERIYDAENPKLVETELKEEVEPLSVEQTQPVKVESMWWVNMRITASTSQFSLIKRFLLDNHISYSVSDKGLVE